MSAVRGFLTGALALIAFEVVVTNADSFSSLIAEVGGSDTSPGLVGHALSADVPLIPDHRASAQPAAKQSGTQSHSGGFDWSIPGGALLSGALDAVIP